jgi:hypothetical protein
MNNEHLVSDNYYNVARTLIPTYIRLREVVNMLDAERFDIEDRAFSSIGFKIVEIIKLNIINENC